MRVHISSLPAFLLVTGALAQGNVGLGFLTGPTPSSAFAAAALGNGITDVTHIGMVPHPNGTPGLFLGGLSVRGLSPALGGRGDLDVVTFLYDRRTDTVTLNANAAALNTTGREFALNWGLDGTYAVFERNSGGLQSKAAVPGGVLALPTAIAGLTSSITDPCPGRVGGRAVLFFIDAQGNAHRDHDVTASAVTGPTVLVSRRVGTDLCHSPWPLHGQDGEAQALLGAIADSGRTQSDWNWQGDLDPDTAAIAQQPTPNAFENNGCEAGGRVYVCQSQSGSYRVLEHDVVGCLGDTVPSSGGLADVTAFAPIKPAAGLPDVTVILNGLGFLASPMAIPGVVNGLGVNPNVMTILGSMVHDNQTGRASTSFPMPPLPVGTVFTLQAVTLLASGTGPVVLSNTFGIRYR